MSAPVAGQAWYRRPAAITNASGLPGSGGITIPRHIFLMLSRNVSFLLLETSTSAPSDMITTPPFPL